jgi:hypothetical protein
MSISLIKMGFMKCPHQQFKYEYFIEVSKNKPSQFNDRVCANKSCKSFGIIQDVITCFDKDEAFYCDDCGEFKEPPIFKRGKCVICKRGAKSSCINEKPHNHFNIRNKTKHWEKWLEYKMEVA